MYLEVPHHEEKIGTSNARRDLDAMGRIVGREFLSFAANAMLFMSSVHICQGPITLSLQAPLTNELGEEEGSKFRLVLFLLFGGRAGDGSLDGVPLTF